MWFLLKNLKSDFENVHFNFKSDVVNIKLSNFKLDAFWIMSSFNLMHD